jgi:hypothetical protein
MLGTHRHELLFPTLQRCSPPPSLAFGIYSLDWSSFDKRLNDKHVLWLHNHHPNADIPFMSGLPKKYEETAQSLRFALDVNYLAEIQRFAREASASWSTLRPFDSAIRDLCLKPAIASIGVAFKLLADCICSDHSPRSNDPANYFAPHMLLHKFWFHQTGGALVERNAEIPALRSYLEHCVRTDLQEPLGAFLKALDAYAEQREKVYALAFRQ